MIRISQGDYAALQLTCSNGDGTAFDLSGATFETRIKGSDGTDQVYANGHHAVTSAPNGAFTLTLSEAETALLGLGAGKEIVTKITQSGHDTYFHAPGILQVLKATPER